MKWGGFFVLERLQYLLVTILSRGLDFIFAYVVTPYSLRNVLVFLPLNSVLGRYSASTDVCMILFIIGLNLLILYHGLKLVPSELPQSYFV